MACGNISLLPTDVQGCGDWNVDMSTLSNARLSIHKCQNNCDCIVTDYLITVNFFYVVELFDQIKALIEFA